MSVGMIITNSPDDADSFYVPVLTESVFNRTVLPVAEQIGAELVCRFGLGLDVEASDADALERELRLVLEHLDPATGLKDGIEARFHNLIAEFQHIFATRPDAIVFIG